MSESHKFYCKDNDNNFILIIEDGELDEIQVGDCLGNNWIVLGINDLEFGLKKIGYSIIKNRRISND